MKKKAKDNQEKTGGKESKSLSYLLQLFNRSGFRNEKQFLGFCKRGLFITLVAVESLMLMQQIFDFTKRGDVFRFVFFLVISVGLLGVVWLNLFLVKEKGKRIFLYVLSGIFVCALLFFNADTTGLAAYILILTVFYVEVYKAKPMTVLLVFGILVYFLGDAFFLQFNVSEGFDFFYVIRKSLGAIVCIVVHYVAVLFALIFYRQYLRLYKALRELDESKKQLEEAYEKVAEVTALEERQRIAKEIHDTAGHSLTTVIMQTEAAKRILEEDPKEAKNKIVAANLQAKHALDELRDSVHLLSGDQTNKTLKSSLEEILHESTDGTGIVIRSEVADATLSPAKQRFLCNSLKEGIANGLRHGGATAFWFELKEEEGKINFLLSDNGCGVKGKMKAGYGLSSMRDRARSLGGEVYFDSEEGEGFELRIVL